MGWYHCMPSVVSRGVGIEHSVLNRFLLKTCSVFVICYISIVMLVNFSLFYPWLITGSTLNSLDVYMKYTAEVNSLHTYAYLPLYRGNPMFEKCRFVIESFTLLVMYWNTPGYLSVLEMFFCKWRIFLLLTGRVVCNVSSVYVIVML